MKEKTVFSQAPFWLPAIYLIVYFAAPAYRDYLAIMTMFLLAEPHFGATWLLLLDKRVRQNPGVSFGLVTAVPLLFMAIILYFIAQNLFYILFFIFNVFHVTKQSAGISQLYGLNKLEVRFAVRAIYLSGLLVTPFAITRYGLNLIGQSVSIDLGIMWLIGTLVVSTYQWRRFRNTEQALGTATGLLMFSPAFFMESVLHASIAGVTMHYSQYLYFIFKIMREKQSDIQSQKNHSSMHKSLRIYWALCIYSFTMTSIFVSAGNSEFVLQHLIIIPIIGQLFHFYIDGFLWKGSDPILRHIHIQPLQR